MSKFRLGVFVLAALAVAAGVAGLYLRSQRKPAPPVVAADPAPKPIEPSAPKPTEEKPVPHAIQRHEMPRAASPDPAPQTQRTVAHIVGVVEYPAAVKLNEPISVELHRTDETPDIAKPTLFTTTALGDDGAFDFEVPTGHYELVAYASGYAGYETTDILRAGDDEELTINLRRAGSVAGRVINDAGEAVAGASVFVAGWDFEGEEAGATIPRSLLSQQTTDASGAFSMDHLRLSGNSDHGFRFAVRAEGYPTFVSDFVAAGKDNVEWILHAGVNLTGSIVNASTGEAVADREIRFEVKAPIAGVSTRSDADGYFFLNDVLPGERTVRLVDNELAITPDTAKLTILATHTPAQEVVLRATPAGHISGRVYEKDSGEGIGGVRVFLGKNRFDFYSESGQNTTTKSDGSYEIGGLGSGSYSVFAMTPDEYSKDWSGQRVGITNEGTHVDHVDFIVERGLRITGTVVDEKGAPVAFAEVSGDTPMSPRSGSGQSKRDGSFVIGGFRAGDRVELDVDKTHFALVKVEPANEIKLADKDLSGVRLVVGAGATISGVVVDAAGRPAADVMISADEEEGQSEWATSEPDGSFEVDGLAPGEYSISAEAARGSNAESNEQKVKVAKGQSVTGIRLMLAAAGDQVVAGRVEDPRGRPIAHADVSLIGNGNYRDATTDSTGAFRISGMVEGDYHVYAAHDSFSQSNPQPVKAGTQDVRIVLTDFATVEGRVVDAVTNRPIQAFQISSGGSGGVDDMMFASAFGDKGLSIRDPEGHFRLTDVNEGATVLNVTADGYAPVKQTIPKISAAENRRDVVIRMNAGATLAGRVVDSAGKPISGAMIYTGKMTFMASFQEPKVTSGADGRFQLASLSVGSVDLTVKHPNFAAKNVQTTVNLSGQNEIEIVLGGGGTVEGVVTLDGKPMQGQSVSVMSLANMDMDRDIKTDASGHYKITGLAAGQTQISVDLDQSGSERSQIRPVMVADSGIMTLNFAFTSGTSAIEGTIFEAEGVPLKSEAFLTVNANDGVSVGEIVSGHSDKNGHFLLEGLAPGTAQLSLHTEDDFSKTITIELPPNQRVHQDIFLFGGATVRVHVSHNASTGATGASAFGMEIPMPVMLMSGKTDIQNLSMESLMTEMPQMVATSTVQNGEAVFKGIEPGTYTVFAISIDPSTMNLESLENPFSGSDTITKVIEVKKDENLDVTLEW